MIRVERTVKQERKSKIPIFGNDIDGVPAFRIAGNLAQKTAVAQDFREPGLENGTSCPYIITSVATRVAIVIAICHFGRRLVHE
jgi:hypothetical protein